MLNQENILKAQNWLLVGIAFFMPLYPRLVPLLIAAFALSSFIALYKRYRTVEVTEVGILMIGLFVLHLIGMLYTDDLARGWFDIEVKLSLLALPISFIGYGRLEKDQYESVLRAFLIGTFIAAIYCLGQSAYKVFIRDFKYYHFLSNRFSVLVHQSYFAMYLVFAMIILSYLEWPIYNRQRIWRSVLTGLGLLFLSVMLILTGSKIGFIMWVVIVFAIAIYMMKDLQQKWIPIGMLMVFMSSGLAIVQSTPELKTRILKVIRLTKGEIGEDVTGNIESTSARYLTYKTAWDVVFDQPWYGAGTGDFQHELDKGYEDRGYVNLKDRHLNAHNLLLQTWLSHGIPGLVLVFSIFLVLFQHSFATGERVYLGFSTLVLLISLTESAFNVQAGVVFFSFFVMLFSRHTMPEKQ